MYRTQVVKSTVELLNNLPATVQVQKQKKEASMNTKQIQKTERMKGMIKQPIHPVNHLYKSLFRGYFFCRHHRKLYSFNA